MIITALVNRVNGADDLPLGDAVMFVEVDLRMQRPFAEGSEGDQQTRFFGRYRRRLTDGDRSTTATQRDKKDDTNHGGEAPRREGGDAHVVRFTLVM
jgi:hypothetical protein